MSEPALAMPTVLDVEELFDNFELLDDWDARYAYLVELGEALPPLEAAMREDCNKVQGCMSQVWVAALPAGDGRLVYQGDCDTAIIKGVLAVLIGLFSGRTAGEITALDADTLFHRLGLKENLSPNRHVGVYAIVDLMKQQARRMRPAD